MHRRTVLRLGTAALGVAALAKYHPSRRVWTGTGFGSELSVIFYDSGKDTERTFAKIEREVERLEEVFSLFRPGSSLSQLNRDGVLRDPPKDLVELLEISRLIWSATGGLFDPSVQLAWRSDKLTYQPVNGFGTVEIREDRIRLMEAGTALTLNGIAQGYASDCLAQMLRRSGHVEHLINMGEYAAGQGEWRLAIENDDARRVAYTDLQNLGLATSSPGAMTRNNGQAHIVHPFGATPRWKTVSVAAKSSALADGYSTALTLMPRSQIDGLDLPGLGIKQIWLEDQQGAVFEVV